MLLIEHVKLNAYRMYSQTSEEAEKSATCEVVNAKTTQIESFVTRE
jgi:hypothetical protein